MPRGYKKTPEDTRRPIVWLDIAKPTRSRSGLNRSSTRKLILLTRSHEITLSEQFADEIYTVAMETLDSHQSLLGVRALIEEVLVSACDQKRTLQRLRAMADQAVEDCTDRIKQAAVEEIQAGWSEAERLSRTRSDARPIHWDIPETGPAPERKERPATE